MTLSHEVELDCPACGAPSPFTEHSSIHVRGNPGLKIKLMNGALNRFQCRACGREAQVEHPVLYNDAADGNLMIQLDPTGELTPESFAALGPAMAPLGDVVTRVVHRRNDLIEKILLADAGLDDRVFEVLKLILVAQEDSLGKASIYFEGIKGHEFTLTILDEEGTSGASIDKGLYDQIRGDLAARGLLAQQPAWAVVDRSFALGWLEQIG